MALLTRLLYDDFFFSIEGNSIATATPATSAQDNADEEKARACLRRAFVSAMCGIEKLFPPQQVSCCVCFTFFRFLRGAA